MSDLAVAATSEGKRAEALARIARNLTDLQDEGAPLLQVCDEVMAVLGTNAAALNLLDETGENFRWAAQRGVPEPLLQPLGLSRELFEQFAARFDPVFSEFRPEALRAEPNLDHFLAYGLCGVASATVRSRGRLLGLMSAACYHEGRPQLIPAELSWLQTVADVVVQAVERERAVRAARLSESRYRRIVSNIRDGVWSVDADYLTDYVNEQLARMLGYEVKEMLGRPLFDFMTEKARRSVGVHIERRRRGASERFEFSLRRKDGTEIRTIVSAAPQLDEAGNFCGALSVVSDLTEQRELELKLQQAQKLESLGVLAGGIAHDFNNLLVGVLGNAGLALDGLAQDSPLVPALTDICAAAQRAAELTRQLLAYSGKGRLSVQRVELNRLVEEMSHLLSSVISKRATLQFDFARDLPPIEADATQIRQVVMNLITNASDALGEHSGAIYVSTGVLHADRAYLSSTYLDDGLEEGDYVFLDVSDSGCGMSPETLQKIFDPFFTTKFTGRGLGLAAVLGILRGHRGAVKVTSDPNQGTSFKVLLPACTDLDCLEEPVAHSSRAYRGAGTILVVDDEASVRAVARRVLEGAGYQVVTAVDGREAVETFERRADDFAGVLLDMTMPRLSGVEALREMRRIRPKVRVILSSAYNEQDATRQLKDARSAGFVQKPWLPADLLGVLDRVLRD